MAIDWWTVADRWVVERRQVHREGTGYDFYPPHSQGTYGRKDYGRTSAAIAEVAVS